MLVKDGVNKMNEKDLIVKKLEQELKDFKNEKIYPNNYPNINDKLNKTQNKILKIIMDHPTITF